MTGKLSIVPTPIGNLGDITSRALEALSSADIVCAEDTRVTGKLLSHFEINTPLQRCDENVIAKRSPALIDMLLEGKNIAFCSDAGMPGVSDPGIYLIDAAYDSNIEVEVLPGACAVTCALVAAAFKSNSFYFGGFLPRKDAQRCECLSQLKNLDAALIFYESPHRVIASIKAIVKTYGDRRYVALCRELTKLHEEVLRLPAKELLENLEARPSIKGEIALVISPVSYGQEQQGEQEQDLAACLEQNETLNARIADELAQGTSTSALARTLSKELGLPKNKLYAHILELAKKA